MITAVLTNPMDIVRTKTQVYTQFGAIETCKYLVKRDGLRGLMTGLSAVCLCCLLHTAVCDTNALLLLRYSACWPWGPPACS